MLRRLTSLIWLRSQVLMSNKNLIIQVLMPYMLVFLYKNFMGTQHNGIEILFVCLSTAMSMSVGSMISTIIAEEKEKNNLKTLLLSGVRYPEYLMSVLFYPVIITLITIVVFPLITEVQFKENFISYILVILLTSLSIMLVNLCIGLLSETQSKAQMNSLPIIFIVSLLPMFSGLKEEVKQIVDWTFMSAYTDFFTKQNFSLVHNSMLVLMLWNIFLVLLTFIALRKNTKTELSFKKSFYEKSRIRFGG